MYNREAYSLVCIKTQNIRKKNQNSKDHLMVIIASVLVKYVEKFELQRKPSQRDLIISSYYRSFWITETWIVETKL